MFHPLVRVASLIGSVASLCVLPLGAQEKTTKETKSAVPRSAEPPAGLCRVWHDNVPASQQPAPTDCATAIRNRPMSARVVFGNVKDDATKPEQRGSVMPASTQRTNNWAPRVSDPSRRFETSPAVPNRQIEPAGASGVRPVTLTVPGRPRSDSVGKPRRPEREQ